MLLPLLGYESFRVMCNLFRITYRYQGMSRLHELIISTKETRKLHDLFIYCYGQFYIHVNIELQKIVLRNEKARKKSLI